MSWFDSQLKTRREKDDDAVADSLDMVASAIMGRRLYEALDSKEIAGSAIEAVLKYYHIKEKSNEIPSRIKTLEEQIDYRMGPFGIMHRTVELRDRWYQHAVGPMIGTLKDTGEAVALIPGKMFGYTYTNLVTGEVVKLNPKTRKNIDTQAIGVYQPLPLRSLKISDLMLFMVKCFSLSDLVMYIGMMAVMAGWGLLSPLFTQWLFSDVLESGSLSVLLALAGFMFSYTLSQLMLSSYQTLVNSRVRTKQDIAVQAAVMNRILSLPPDFFKNYASGELNQRASYVMNLCSTMMNSIGTVGLTSVFSLIYIGQIFVFAPALVIPSVMITLTSILLSMLMTVLRMDISKRQMQAASVSSGVIYSMIRGVQKIKLAGAEKRMFARWLKGFSVRLSLQYNVPPFLKYGSVLSMAVSAIGTLILYYCAVKSNVGVANYYAFNSSYGMVAGAFSSAASIVMTMSNIKPTLDMAKPLLEVKPEVSEGKAIITDLKGNIELSNVSFHYNEDTPNVINDLSLRIRKGEYIAIVGSTGCGKSTLMRLLLGFETPQKGMIYYDHKDISKIDLKSLRRNIGTVMQDGKLFLGDIYSNIVISAPQLTMDEAWKAAEIASIADDIRNMPMGMSTIISEGQGGISGGQKQRLMIARAIAPNPSILMFDEATSALDNVTQRKISEAINRLKCTRIVIAHRLSTIRHADRIIYLDGGKIAEEGTYDELIEKNGLFADLVKRQRLDIDVE